MKRPIIVLICLFSINLASLSQGYEITDFVETKLPKVRSDEWFELNYSRNEFKVFINDGAIKVENADEEKAAILETEAGQLIGSDHGEWGGKIEFVLKGTTEKKLIKEGNVKFVFKFQNEIFFIEGLAHLSMSKGTMYRLDQKADTFVPVKVIEFEDAQRQYASWVTIYSLPLIKVSLLSET